LIAFQPRIEEPSKATPLLKASSSTSSGVTVRCCHLPCRSMNFRSNQFDALVLDLTKDVLGGLGHDESGMR